MCPSLYAGMGPVLWSFLGTSWWLLLPGGLHCLGSMGRQIDGAPLTLRGIRVGFPGLACANLCDGDWLCSWLASFL